jgi:hypothetical protein
MLLCIPQVLKVGTTPGFLTKSNILEKMNEIRITCRLKMGTEEIPKMLCPVRVGNGF